MKSALKAAALAMATCSALGPISAIAASGSVGVSLTFSVAPANLFRAAAISPQDVRACEAMKSRIDARWAGQSRSPSLTCDSGDAMPLIVTDLNIATLIVRP